MDYNQTKLDWDRDGFTVIRGFLDDKEVFKLRAEIDRYIKNVLPVVPENDVMYEVPGSTETLKRLGHMSKYDPYFQDIIHQGKFIHLAELLLGGDVVPQYCQLFNKPARLGDETPPHQDGFYIPLIPQEALTMWLALDTSDESNGCMRYIPGAHKNGIRPHRLTKIIGFSQGITDFAESDRNKEISVPANPGDLLIHHWLMIHRASPNFSDRERWGLGSVFYSHKAKSDTEKQAAYQKDLEKAQSEWANPNMNSSQCR